MAPIAPARFYSFTDVEQNTREQVQRPGHIHGSPRKFRSGDSSMTSTAGGSVKCSRRGRPSVVSKGVAARGGTGSRAA
jgi:hypothetical protein